MDTQTIARLYDYNFWADHRTIDSCATLTTEQLLKPVGGSFGSLRNTLAHIMDVEWLYLERWQGRVPPSLPKAEDYPDLAAIRARWKDVETNLTRYVGGLSDADLAARGRISQYERNSLPPSALGNDAAPRKSRHLSSRTGGHFAADAGHFRAGHGPDRVLSRTLRPSHAIIPADYFCLSRSSR